MGGGDAASLPKEGLRHRLYLLQDGRISYLNPEKRQNTGISRYLLRQECGKRSDSIPLDGNGMGRC